MNENVQNLINAIADGDAVGTEVAFNAALADKISARLDTMRQEVAQTMFASQQAVVEEEIDLDAEILAEEEVQLSEEEITEIAEKYEGFSKLSGELKAKGAKDPDALAAWIGRKKMGKKAFQAKAAAGK